MKTGLAMNRIMRIYCNGARCGRAQGALRGRPKPDPQRKVPRRTNTPNTTTRAVGDQSRSWSSSRTGN